MEYIAFDAHKYYTLASVARPDGRLVREQLLAHKRGAFQQFWPAVSRAPRSHWRRSATGTGSSTRSRPRGASPSSCTRARRS
jgi:hypothetical protein